MGDKTSDEGDDASDIEELVKVSSNNMDSSCDESDKEELQELTGLSKSFEHRPPGSMPPDMKSSLYAKFQTKRLTICPSSFNEQKGSTLKKIDQMMLDFVKSGQNREVKCLLVHGAKIDSHDTSENTGLHIGAKFGFLKIVETFLDRLLDVDTKGFDNNTALIQASFAGETAVVKLLLSFGPDIEHVNKSGNTALTEAIANGHPDRACNSHTFTFIILSLLTKDNHICYN